MRLLITGILTLIIYVMTCAYGRKAEKTSIPAPVHPIEYNHALVNEYNWQEMLYHQSPDL